MLEQCKLLDVASQKSLNMIKIEFCTRQKIVSKGVLIFLVYETELKLNNPFIIFSVSLFLHQ